MALVAVILGFSASAVAQNGMTIRVGANLPVGSFAQGKSAAELALSNPEATLGGAAAAGFNAGLKYQFEVIDNLGLFATADFFYNGLNGDIKEAWKGDSEGITLPAYMNMPVMLGVNYSILDIIGTTLWVEAGAGANFRSISKSSAEYSAEVPLVGTVDASAETTYNVGTSFAWQAGFGVCFDNTITLGVHYYGFGKAPISYETAIDASASNIGSGGINNILGEEGKFTGGKLNPSMVVIRLGYTF